MKKDEFIARYGEEEWEKKLAQTRLWKKAHREKQQVYSEAWKKAHREYDKDWRETHPDQVHASHNEENYKGGKYYEKKLVAQCIGLQGEKNKIRKMHCQQYKTFKDIIAPDSQIHHEWIPLSSEYRGLASTKAKPHQYGIIDVIVILDGKITVLTEEEVKNSKKKQDDTV